jgi:hypothetical protein
MKNDTVILGLADFRWGQACIIDLETNRIFDKNAIKQTWTRPLLKAWPRY